MVRRSSRKKSGRKNSGFVKKTKIQKTYGGKKGTGRANVVIAVKKSKNGYRLYETSRYTGKTESKRYALSWYKKAVKQSKKRLGK